MATGRCQTPRGECLHKGTKEFSTEEQGGTQSLWDFWDKGCPEQQEGWRTVEERIVKRLVVCLRTSDVADVADHEYIFGMYLEQ